MRYFTLGYLLDLLKQNKLPASRPKFNAFEEAGMVNKPQNEVLYRRSPVFGSRTMRIYSEEEIKKIINQVWQMVFKKKL